MLGLRSGTYSRKFKTHSGSSDFTLRRRAVRNTFDEPADQALPPRRVHLLANHLLGKLEGPLRGEYLQLAFRRPRRRLDLRLSEFEYFSGFGRGGMPQPLVFGFHLSPRGVLEGRDFLLEVPELLLDRAQLGLRSLKGLPPLFQALPDRVGAPGKKLAERLAEHIGQHSHQEEKVAQFKKQFFLSPSAFFLFLGSSHRSVRARWSTRRAARRGKPPAAEKEQQTHRRNSELQGPTPLSWPAEEDSPSTVSAIPEASDCRALWSSCLAASICFARSSWAFLIQTSASSRAFLRALSRSARAARRSASLTR